MHVLVVEDEVKMAALIRRGLAEQGLAVDVASSGEEAFVMAGSSTYDAVVLDVILPGSTATRPAGGCGRTASGRRC
jgi:two-component system OmpR family response regulator